MQKKDKRPSVPISTILTTVKCLSSKLPFCRHCLVLTVQVRVCYGESSITCGVGTNGQVNDVPHMQLILLVIKMHAHLYYCLTTQAVFCHNRYHKLVLPFYEISCKSHQEAIPSLVSMTTGKNQLSLMKQNGDNNLASDVYTIYNGWMVCLLMPWSSDQKAVIYVCREQHNGQEGTLSIKWPWFNSHQLGRWVPQAMCLHIICVNDCTGIVE